MFLHNATGTWEHVKAACQPQLLILCLLKLVSLIQPSACPKWTHGAGCSKECICVQEHSTGCDPKTGSCFCKAAYQGPRCEKGRRASLNTKSFIHRQLQRACSSEWSGAESVFLHFLPAATFLVQQPIFSATGGVIGCVTVCTETPEPGDPSLLPSAVIALQCWEETNFDLCCLIKCFTAEKLLKVAVRGWWWGCQSVYVLSCFVNLAPCICA